VPAVWSRAKVIATLGPASSSETVVRDLVRHGMDVARLNFSHSSHGEQAARARAVRKAAKLWGRPIGILQDLPGPKIRLGLLPSEGVFLKRGQEVFLTPDPAGPGIPVLYPRLREDLKPGQPVFIADGAIRLMARKTTSHGVLCGVAAGGRLRAGNGVNLPRSNLSLRAFTAADRRHLEFGLGLDVDFVGVSFAGSAADMTAARSFAAARGRAPFLIAKIERRAAVKNLKSVIEASDGVMVARGDLGVEVPFADIPGLQEEILYQARRQGKPAIVATQMLESMIESPRPTRAEVTDAANAVLESADALMLSGETAVGKYPVEAVKALNAIIRRTERRRSRLHQPEDLNLRDASDIITREAVDLAVGLSAKALVVLTRSGNAAARVSRLRPSMPTLAFSRREVVRRRFALYGGVDVLALTPPEASEASVAWTRRTLRTRGWARPGESVVILSDGPGLPKGETGRIEILRV